jgi:small subunit ribosomal protein S7
MSRKANEKTRSKEKYLKQQEKEGIRQIIDLGNTSRQKNTLLTSTSDLENKYIIKFINSLMFSGKKTTAERILSQSFDLVKKTTHSDPIQIFEKAIQNVEPIIQMRSIRVAGSNYQVPVEINPSKQMTYAIKWIIESARKRNEKGMAIKLCKEFIDASKNTGQAVQKKETIHRMAESNRAYTHYRW